MAVKPGLWSQNGGGCWKVTIGGVIVKFVEAGHGDYACAQHAPEGYSDEELESIAEEVMARLRESPEIGMLSGCAGPGRIIGCNMAGQYHRHPTELDCAGNPRFVWRQYEPLRGTVEIELPEAV